MRITPRTMGTYLDRIRVKYSNVGRHPRRRRCARAIQDGLIDVDDLSYSGASARDSRLPSGSTTSTCRTPLP